MQALEGAYAQAQKQVDMAVATTEQLKTFDLRSQVASLHTDMMVRLSDLELNRVSAEEVARLQDTVTSKSEEFQAVRENLSDVASSNKALAGSMKGLSSSFASTMAKVTDQAALVDTLTAQLAAQVSELLGLKETLTVHRAQLETSAQDIASVKGLLEVEQAKRTKILGKQLTFVRRSLEDQSQEALSLHSSLRAQLESIQSQLEENPLLEQPAELDEEHRDHGELELQKEVDQEVQEDVLGHQAEAQVDQEVQEEEVEQELQTELGVQEEEVEQEVQTELGVQEDEVEQEVQTELGVQEEEVEQEAQTELGIQEEEVEQEVQADEVVEEVTVSEEAYSEQQEEQEELTMEENDTEEEEAEQPE
ncbi:hypothetical protein SKAU_G00169520 [Synaphobranchus kaupii]|uniref:Uncharacterized protein n=1 Tax=Synaphobranchus kaupii TaxID=118154 RepID=A0A9Q1FK37_SYNKA|nr:hypothetical protein SKAU_G00169520 [Synaphobranchus kaupii]